MTDDQTRREERYGMLLLSPLRDEPRTPSRVDVARAMAEGRRRRVRWWAGGAAIVALTGTVATGGALAISAGDKPDRAPAPRIVSLPSPPAPVVGPTGCTVQHLPDDGAAQAFVTGGDPTGHYLVGQIYGSKKPVVIWKDGTIVARMTMPGASNRSLKDLNTAGAGVASSYDSGGQQHSYAYRNHRFSLLKGGVADATEINDAGVIAGTLGGDRPRPAIWSSPTAAPQRLELPAGVTIGGVDGIDEDGTVVGTVGKPTSDLTGYVWSKDGTGHRMPLPTVDGKPARFFWPEGISNGWVAGRAVLDSPGGGERSFAWYRYRVATATYEALPEASGMPAGVAANGWVAGVGPSVTITAEGAGVVTLPQYRGLTGDSYQLTSYSADGRTIGGYSSPPSLKNDPLMWRCH